MRLPLTVRWTDENVVGEAVSESREVSSRGLYFHLPNGLKSGSAVEIVMTLPHELARVVLSEQVYRAFTILAGHPYHTGH